MTPLYPRGPTLQRRDFLKSLAGLTAVGLISRHTGSLYGAQVEAPSKPHRLIVDADTANEIDDEFNTNNDPNALDVLLNAPGLEFHLMTATASQSLVFEKTAVDRHLKGKGAVADHLVGIWDNYDRVWQRRVAPTKATWVMWDIALIEAIARPQLAKSVTITAPPENRQRSISVWVGINDAGMREDFWRTTERWLAGGR